jgi:predicted nucleic acid-binding protein
MMIEDKFLIDTNILIYFFNLDSEFYDFTGEIITKNIGKIYLAQKSISEFVCVLSKLGKYEIIENELFKIISRFNILYPGELSVKIFVELVKKHKPFGSVVYDYEIASVMLANGIKKIVTINVGDFKNIKQIEIITKERDQKI